MQTVINNRKLISSIVSKTSSRFTTSIFYNGFYYEFPKSNDTYPLELAISQIPILKKFDLVFIENEAKDCFIGVFNKTPSRKTIEIQKLYFITQLSRYQELYKYIAIVNNADLYKSDNALDVFSEGVELIAIEKLPELIDPNKTKLLIKKYVLFFGLFICSYIIYSIQINNLTTELSVTQQQLKNENALNVELIKKEKNQTMPIVPSKQIQIIELKNVYNQIDNGAL